MPYNAVDLFAGGGGLSIGLKAAGFNIVSAIEIEDAAFSTYKANHPEVHCFKGNIQHLTAADIYNASPNQKIDLIAGCPPCQGFTSLTSKYRREDLRNSLIREMLRLISEIKPTAVMLENVPLLAQRGKYLFTEFLDSIKSLGYATNFGILNAADFGVPQNRKRLVLVAGRGFEIKLPKPTHSKDGSGGLAKWRPVGGTLHGLGRAVTLNHANKDGDPRGKNWHVVRTLSKENLDRLKIAKPGKTWKEIPEEIRPNCHRGGYSGFSNVYGRMKKNDVSPTITGGCTTLSKGRFGHPTAQRTISVREAARIQTFPDSFLIDTPYMDKACNIIGNAFPCLLAQRIAESCLDSLKKHSETEETIIGEI